MRFWYTWPICAGQAKKKPSGGGAGFHSRTLLANSVVVIAEGLRVRCWPDVCHREPDSNL